MDEKLIRITLTETQLNELQRLLNNIGTGQTIVTENLETSPSAVDSTNVHLQNSTRTEANQTTPPNPSIHSRTSTPVVDNEQPNTRETLVAGNKDALQFDSTRPNLQNSTEIEAIQTIPLNPSRASILIAENKQLNAPPIPPKPPKHLRAHTFGHADNKNLEGAPIPAPRHLKTSTWQSVVGNKQPDAPPVPPKSPRDSTPSTKCEPEENLVDNNKNNVQENKDVKNGLTQSVIQKSNAKSAKYKPQLRKKSDRQTIFTRTLEVLDFQDVEYDEVYERIEESNEQNRSSMAIKELIATEESYVKILEQALLYKADLETSLKPDIISYLFGNIEKIHKNQKKFLKLLKRSKNEDDIGAAFIFMEQKFENYIPYVRNKIKSDEVLDFFNERIKSTQKNLNDRLDLQSHLLSPIQRLGRYVLLLGAIEKHLIKQNLNSKHIQSSKAKIQDLMRRINDLVSIDLIKNLPSNLDLNNGGNFIMKESFKLLKPFALDIIAFLFHNVMVITMPAKNQTAECLYLKHLHLNAIKLLTRQDDTFTFTLEKCDDREHVDKNMNTYEFKTEKEEIKKHWEEILRKVLWEQYAEIKATAQSTFSVEAVDYIQRNKPLNQFVIM